MRRRFKHILTLEQLRQSQINWYNENKDLGKELGYPDCCIKAFGMDSPEYMKAKSIFPIDIDGKKDQLRLKHAHINGKFTGFIPCWNCTMKIMNGKIKLGDLIENRNPKFPPFPNALK